MDEACDGGQSLAGAVKIIEVGLCVLPEPGGKLNRIESAQTEMSMIRDQSGSLIEVIIVRGHNQDLTERYCHQDLSDVGLPRFF